ncbi:hypothetical protein CTI12_AA507900 [Artemisia annua]|uniref:SWIM-type domain-containing protein n=1 Tax=Artemisia annua TaxID=35608 RepID=A0A2U1LBY5_ARTAN|nr:hypothetical protein CTI12_AA507900 [Artemisia annua]
MASLTIRFHHDGLFIGLPIEYIEGNSDTIKDVEFDNMTYDKCFDFLAYASKYPVVGLYYCVPGCDLTDGIREIKSNQQLGDFVAVGLEYGGKIDVYLEHHGDAKALVEDEIEDLSVDPIYKVKKGVNYHDHDPNLSWNEMVSILGMKFEDHEQMKIMLANYAVANGYQLWYKRNDYKLLLALCGRNVSEGRCASKVDRRKSIADGSNKFTKKVVEGSSKEKVAEGTNKGKKRKTTLSNDVCKFRLWGSWMQNEASFQIKTLILDHTCAGYLIMVHWSHLSGLDKFKIHVSLGQCRRAKQRALYEIEGGLIEHYGKLWDYRDRILKTNPGSTVKLDVEEGSGSKTNFKRIYVCFKALKDGWTVGCRKVIGLDGCFLKGTIKGELLTAIGRDANNQMFPIAWAVINVENKDNWLWFLVSLGSKRSSKGMVTYAEHRQCTRHIYANLKKSWPGLYFKNIFWGAASTTMKDQVVKPTSKESMYASKLYIQLLSFCSLERWMNCGLQKRTIKGELLTAMGRDANNQMFPIAWAVINVENKDNWLWFLVSLGSKRSSKGMVTYAEHRQCSQIVGRKGPKYLEQNLLQMNRSCGAFENGICESYHASIINQRGKPIITMLEDIRIYLMQRLVVMSDKARELGDVITPSVRKEIEHKKKFLTYWEMYVSGYKEFKVRKLNEGYGANLETHTCTCRLWDLTGIPCIHAIAA